MDNRIREILSLPAHQAARKLIGATLVVGRCSGVIVEAEAYRQNDRASHSYSGPTPRNRSMFLAPGHVYVYRSYGVHWCLNLVTGKEGVGEAVLVRAIEPVNGISVMRRRRGQVPDRRLCSGPGNLTKAFGITGEFDGTILGQGIDVFSGCHCRVAACPRIGISKDTERMWRFVMASNPFVSRR